MKKLATAIATIALIGTPAFAAPPAPSPEPIFSWTGWYVGVNAGASFGSDYGPMSAFGTKQTMYPASR